MAAIDFPASPTIGEVFTTTDRQWIWDGTKWNTYGTGHSVFTPSATPPTSPDAGDIWFDTNTGRSYIWYDSAWVEMTGAPASMDASLLTGATLASNVVNASIGRGWRNRIINGSFDVWQRGFGFFTGSGYMGDQWFYASTGTTHSVAAYGITPGNTIPGYEPRYYLRTVVTSVAGASNYSLLRQNIESVRTFAGQTVTLSFWAKADAAKNIAIEFEQNFGTGGSPSATVSGIGAQLVALTTTWQRFTRTIAIPSIAGKTLGTTDDGKLMLNFWFDAGSSWAARTANLGQQSGTFDIWGVQLEPGTVATPFEVKPYSDTLRDCQRYYYTALCAGVVHGTGRALFQGALPDMRTTNPAVTIPGNLGNMETGAVIATGPLTGSPIVKSAQFGAYAAYAANTPVSAVITATAEL